MEGREETAEEEGEADETEVTGGGEVEAGEREGCSAAERRVRGGGPGGELDDEATALATAAAACGLAGSGTGRIGRMGTGARLLPYDAALQATLAPLTHSLTHSLTHGTPDRERTLTRLLVAIHPSDEASHNTACLSPRC